MTPLVLCIHDARSNPNPFYPFECYATIGNFTTPSTKKQTTIEPILTLLDFMDQWEWNGNV